jgi:TPR repeat protein
MSKFAFVVLCLFLSASAYAADSPSCPQHPGAHPNAARARSFVCTTDIDGLEKYFAQRHREYEAGEIDGGQLLWTYDQLWEPYPLERLQEWLARYPDSHAAHLAVSEALIKRAFYMGSQNVEGWAVIPRWIALYLLQRRIDGYLQRSLSLSKKPYLTYYYLVRAERTSSVLLWRRDSVDPRPAARAYVEQAAKIDGPAFVARAAYMISLQPDWGGNVVAMRRHLEDSLNVGLNKAQLGRLESMLVFEESRLKHPDREVDVRLRMAARANELHEDVRYLKEIIWLKVRADRWADALPELNRVLEISPNDRWVLSRHATALFNLNRHAEAYEEFLILAKDGNAYAQNKVGYYLSMGIGVPQDKREGAKWFAKSAAGGDKHGIDNLKRAREEGSI